MNLICSKNKKLYLYFVLQEENFFVSSKKPEVET